MNERIKELLKQASKLANTDDNKDIDRNFDMIVAEKFARLIIRECMRQVEEQYIPVLEDETMMKNTHWDGYVQCGVDSYVAIRDHFFGVE
jgi:hypothetical protein